MFTLIMCLRSLFLSAIIILLMPGNVTAQTHETINTWLASLQGIKDSKEITATQQAKDVIALGGIALSELAIHFSDSIHTAIFSNCQQFNLTTGETAIILADKIEGMPYAHLTHIKNCLAEFCPGNPNLIEFYLPTIRYQGIETFQKKYLEWLNSEDRRKTNTIKKAPEKRRYTKIITNDSTRHQLTTPTCTYQNHVLF